MRFINIKNEDTDKKANQIKGEIIHRLYKNFSQAVLQFISVLVSGMLCNRWSERIVLDLFGFYHDLLALITCLARDCVKGQKVYSKCT